MSQFGRHYDLTWLLIAPAAAGITQHLTPLSANAYLENKEIGCLLEKKLYTYINFGLEPCHKYNNRVPIWNNLIIYRFLDLKACNFMFENADSPVRCIFKEQQNDRCMRTSLSCLDSLLANNSSTIAFHMQLATWKVWLRKT